MTCLGLRCGHNNLVPCSEEQYYSCFLGGTTKSLSNRNMTSSLFFGLGQQSSSRVPGRLSVVANGAAQGVGVAVNSDSNNSSSSVFDHQDDVRNYTNGVLPRKRVVNKEEIVSRKVDQWIRDSVEEIVSNIEEAPFLVHIYSDNDQEVSSASTKTRVVREKASADTWPAIKTRWEGGSSIPNGIALVEELQSHNALLTSKEQLTIAGTDENQNQNQNQNQPCSSTKVWGIVIQEKGLSCPACYILKTSRVRSVSGICTHFCLFRVECFTESAEMQLKNLWLL